MRHHAKKPRLIVFGLCLASQSLCTKPVVVDGAQLTTLVEFTIDAELYVDEIVYWRDTAHILGLFHSSVYHASLLFVCLHRPAASGVPLSIDVYGCRALKTSAPAPSMHAKTATHKSHIGALARSLLRGTARTAVYSLDSELYAEAFTGFKQVCVVRGAHVIYDVRSHVYVCVCADSDRHRFEGWHCVFRRGADDVMPELGIPTLCACTA